MVSDRGGVRTSSSLTFEFGTRKVVTENGVYQALGGTRGKPSCRKSSSKHYATSRDLSARCPTGLLPFRIADKPTGSYVDERGLSPPGGIRDLLRIGLSG